MGIATGLPLTELNRAEAGRMRARRVVLLLAALIVLGLGDLYATVTHATSIGMRELNPVGAYLIAAHSVFGLVLYKLGTMGLTTGLLMKVRHHALAELSSWLLVCVMVGLTIHWSNYNHQLSEKLTNTSYDEAAAELQLTAAGPPTQP